EFRKSFRALLHDKTRRIGNRVGAEPPNRGGARWDTGARKSAIRARLRRTIETTARSLMPGAAGRSCVFKGGDALLQIARNQLRRLRFTVLHRPADYDPHLPALGVVLAFGAQFRDSTQVHRHHGNAQLRSQQADARAKWVHLDGARALAFGEDEDAPAAIDQIAGKSEALPKSRTARQWKQVEDGDDEPVRHSICDAPQKAAAARRAAHGFEALAIHRNRQTTAQALGQAIEDACGIEVGDVVRNHQHGTARFREIFAAQDYGPAQDV